MYLLDANAFIQVYKAYYPPDIFPCYWSVIRKGFLEKKMLSIKGVKDEIEDSEIVEWIKQAEISACFISRTDAYAESLAKITAWCTDPKRKFKTNKIQTFLRGADSHLIAHAHTGKHTIVTLEKPREKGMVRGIKIPDVCDEFEVRWMKPYEMLRAENIVFK